VLCASRESQIQRSGSLKTSAAMIGAAATRVLVVLFLAQSALGHVGEKRQDPEEVEGPEEDEPETAQAEEPVKSTQQGDTVNFAGKAGGSLQSFGQGKDQTMPYQDFEVFGRSDTADDLTRKSIEESDKMIDQIEKAEVAETKRSTYRALTRLRGAATAAFDGVARTQVGNIDEYAKTNRYLDTNKIRHLADEESNTEYWAFPHGEKEEQLLSVKKTNPELYHDLVTSDAIERRAAETDKKASLVAEVDKSKKFWDDFMMKEAESTATRAAKGNNGAGWKMVDSFLTGMN